MYAYICSTYVSLLRNNTYITAMYIFTYETPTYSTSLPSFLAAFLRHSIFLASFLIWPTKSTLALCVLVSPLSLYTIWHFYKLQIHTRTHARASKRNHTFPPGVGLLLVALAFSICAL